MFRSQALRHRDSGITFGKLARSIGFITLSDLAKWQYDNRKYVRWFTSGGIDISR